MAARFVRVDRETQLLLPPDMRQWFPENHLSQFILDAVEEMDASGAKINRRGSVRNTRRRKRSVMRCASREESPMAKSQ
jgi:glyoxylate carboligase